MISVRATTSCLFILTFFLALAAFFMHAPLNVRTFANNFLSENAGIVTSVGTLILVGGLTLCATHLANVSAEKRELNNRRISSEIKKSEFRQAWINALRDDLSELVGLAQYDDDANTLSQAVSKMKMLNARIILRLNPDAEPEKKIKRQVTDLVNAAEQQSEALPALRDKLANDGAIFIKLEWENLKSLLEEAKRGAQS